MVAALRCGLHQGLQNVPAKAAAAQHAVDGHAANAGHARMVWRRLQQPPGRHGLPQTVHCQGVDRRVVGVVPFHFNRNALLVHKHLGAHLLRAAAQRLPAPNFDVHHALARFKAGEHVAQRGGHRF